MKFDSILDSDYISLLLEHQIANIQNIKKSFPSIWQLASEAISLTEILIPFVKANMRNPVSEHQKYLLTLWKRISSYQNNSILQIFGRNLDEGLSILRMAAELCFVFKSIYTDESNINRFLKNSQSKSFKKAGKMDLGDLTEKRIYNLYKFCCNFGTHGHKTNLVFEDSDIEPYQPSLQGVSQIAKHWFVSFMPLHSFAFERLLSGNQWEGIEEWRLAMIKTEVKLVKAANDDPFFML